MLRLRKAKWRIEGWTIHVEVRLHVDEKLAEKTALLARALARYRGFTDVDINVEKDHLIATTTKKIEDESQKYWEVALSAEELIHKLQFFLEECEALVRVLPRLLE